MKALKNILGRLFALWALVLFSLTLFLVALLLLATNLVAEPKRSIITQKIFVGWMKVFFFLAGVRREFKGYEHFKPGQVYVITCNHQSFMDPPLSSTGIPGPNRTIAKEEMARIPVFGIVYRRGSVLVNRKSEESRKLSYKQMKDVLRRGMHMCIYPEGTRNRSTQPLQRFHDGAFRLAIEAGHDLMPAVLFNTGKVLPPNKAFYFWPHPIAMHFLQPISVKNKTVESLKEETFRVMQEYYLKHQ